MARAVDELRVFSSERLVIASGHLDALDTGAVPAFADELEVLTPRPPEKNCQIRDPAVDLAEDRGVQAEALFTYVDLDVVPSIRSFNLAAANRTRARGEAMGGTGLEPVTSCL